MGRLSLSPSWVPFPCRCTLLAMCPRGSLRRLRTKRGSGRASTRSTLRWSRSTMESSQGSSLGITTPTAFGCSMMMQVLKLEGTCQPTFLLLSPASLSPAVSLLTGTPISVMFLTPGVTPWKTTLPGVVNGANNPGIRVFEYDRATLTLQVRNPGSAGARGGGTGGEGKDLNTPPPSLILSQLIHALENTEPQEGQVTSTLLELRIRTPELLILPPNLSSKSGHFFSPKCPFALDHCHGLLPGLPASSTALL